MALCLLLTGDASLPSEMESGLSLLPSPPTLLPVGRDQELEDVLKSVTDVQLLIVDLRYFMVPANTDVPVLVVDDESSPPIPQPHPCILLPIRSAELTSLITYLLNHPKGAGNVHGGNPLSFFLRVQREVLHDLNNRQTTIQGHLPLLTDTCLGDEKEILSDIRTAAEQAGKLLRILEAMNPDATCVPNPVSLVPFLKQLSALTRRVLSPLAQAEFQLPEDDIYMLADEALLTLCLLTGLDMLSSPHVPCRLHTQPEGSQLRIRVQTSDPIEAPGTAFLNQMNQRLHPMGAKVSVAENGLIFTLKTDTPLPAPE